MNAPASTAPKLDRRSLLFAFGVASVSQLLPAQLNTARKVATAKPNENRFRYQKFDVYLTPACKVTSEDSAGTISLMELTIPPRSGPPLHAHHREDETYYVLSGEFQFEVGGEKYSLPQGSTIFAPREIPHRWANIAMADAKLILVCTPAGFERFFDETAKAILDKAPMEQMAQIMSKYGIDPLGPPLFPPE